MRKKDKDSKREYIMIRVNESERKEFDKVAKFIDSSLSDMIRKLVNIKYTELKKQIEMPFGK